MKQGDAQSTPPRVYPLVGGDQSLRWAEVGSSAVRSTSVVWIWKFDSLVWRSQKKSLRS